MTGPKFRIEVGNGQVGGTLYPGERKFDPDKLTHDPLQLDTLALLEGWLKRWEWIARYEQDDAAGLDSSATEVQRSLLVPDTAKVLGSHLWQLLLSGRTGEQLIRAYDDVRRTQETLRVLISFEDELATRELAGLPWEFLYYPGTSSRRGFFLATRAELVLGRCLPRAPRSVIHNPEQLLRVVFWVTLPDSDEFNAERNECLKTQETLRKNHSEVLDLPDPVIGWKPGEVAAHLGSKADIVHVIGVGRPKRDSTAVELLVHPAGTRRWIDSNDLVDALTRNPANRPELVVLHLCDWQGSDTSENFEQLAPILVKEQIPAVLAMQYPMAPGDTDRFISVFYDTLIDDGDIGRAVQAGRLGMYEFGGRRFGAPVLYMQSDDGRLLVDDTSPQHRPGDLPAGDPVGPETDSLGMRIREELLYVADVESPDPLSRTELRDWIEESSPWPDDREKAWGLVKGRARDHAHETHLRPLYAKLVGTVMDGAGS